MQTHQCRVHIGGHRLFNGHDDSRMTPENVIYRRRPTTAVLRCRVAAVTAVLALLSNDVHAAQRAVVENAFAPLSRTPLSADALNLLRASEIKLGVNGGGGTTSRVDCRNGYMIGNVCYVHRSALLGTLMNGYDRHVGPRGAGSRPPVGVQTSLISVENVDDMAHRFTLVLFVRMV